MGEADIKKAAHRADEDDALVRQAQRRDPAAREAFGRLILKYQDRIYASLLRMVGNRDDALEIAQEAFLRAYEGIGRFKGESKFFTWLWTIALNLRTSRWRSRRASPVSEGLSVNAARSDEEQPGLPAMDPASPDRGPAHRVEADELNAAIEAEMSALPPDYREILMLRDVEGLEYADICAALRLPEGTVKSRLHRARMELRQRLDRYL